MTASRYRKSATRDVRPFFEVATLEEAVHRAQIRLFDGQDFTTDDTFAIDEHDAQRLSPTVRLNIADGSLTTTPIPREALMLAVTAVNPFLKKTVLVRSVSLAGEVPGDIAIGSDVLQELGGGSNVTVEVALCLAARLGKRPGQPFMQGHWLSKKSFELRPPRISDDFEVEATDDLTWKALGLPKRTLYHVEYYAGFNEPVTRDQPLAKVRIHSDVYRKFAIDSPAKMSRPMMAFLAAEISCQLLAASLGEWKEAEAPVPRSPLAAFLGRLKRLDPNCTLADLRSWVESPGMPRLRAVLHADQETVRKVVEA